MKVIICIFLHALACTIFIMGKTMFDYSHDFDWNPYWLGNNEYYVWDKLCFLLLVLCIIMPCKEMRPCFYIMVVIMFFRLIDEIPVVRDNIWWTKVHGMFYVDIICLGAFFIYMPIVMAKLVKKESTFVSEDDDVTIG